jgi:hypothetical protein
MPHKTRCDVGKCLWRSRRSPNILRGSFQNNHQNVSSVWRDGLLRIWFSSMKTHKRSELHHYLLCSSCIETSSKKTIPLFSDRSGDRKWFKKALIYTCGSVSYRINDHNAQTGYSYDLFMYGPPMANLVYPVDWWHHFQSEVIKRHKSPSRHALCPQW